MATTIITKNGSGAPADGDLSVGELAVDLTNKQLYTKDSNGVIKLGGSGNSGEWEVNGSDIYYDTGNVGVGESSQFLGRLHIKGSDMTATYSGVDYESLVAARPSDNLGVALIGVNSASKDVLVASNQNDGDLVFGTRTGGVNYERVRISGDNGNVGIGTNNPSNPLHINCDATTVAQKISTNVSSSEGDGDFLQAYTINGICSSLNLIREGSSNTGLAFKTTASGTLGEKVRVSSSGNVGIGHSSPVAKLAILGGSNDTVSEANANLCVEGGGGNGILFGTKATSPYRSYIQSGFVADLGTATYDLLLNPEGGNVGIGNTGPTRTLDIGDGTLSANAEINSSSVPNFLFSRADVEVGYIGTTLWNTGSGSDTEMSIRGSSAITFAIGSAEKIRIDSTGNLLVGTSSFGGFKQKVVQSTNLGICALHNTLTSGLNYDQFQVLTDHGSSTNFHLMRCYVSGGSNVQFAVRGDGVVFAQNTAIQSLSDGRIKENVRDSEQGLDVITALRPVRFDFKEGFGNDQKNQLGFIAQEVEAVFPDAVMEASEKTEREEPLKSLGPAALIPVMVKAIQELSGQVDELKAEVAALKGA